MKLQIRAIVAMLVLAGLSGCSLLWTETGQRSGVSSSLVDYLYPNGEEPPGAAAQIPHLELPLRVGIAFVPRSRGHHPVAESTRITLLDEVSAAFVEQPYIEHIEVIPESYLRAGTGVRGMQQVARLYGVDVMALVSYDQVASTSENAASFLYWTIVGAYVIPGTDNHVQTFVDTAVFDVDTARLLFRAPGIHEDSGRTAAVGAHHAVYTQQSESFAAAVSDMQTNLGTELVRFEEAVKNNPERVRVTHSPGYGGGGQMGWLMLMLLIGIAVGRMSTRYAPRAADGTR